MSSAKVLKELGKRDAIERSYEIKPDKGTDNSQQNQAADLYTAFKKHFLLNERELKLIQDITGIDTFVLRLKEITAKKHTVIPTNKKQLKDFYKQLIEQEIAEREQYNRTHWFGKKSIENLRKTHELVSKVVMHHDNFHKQFYSVYIELLETRIRDIKAANQGKWFWQRKSAYHLELVKQMLEYHRDARSDLLRPVDRMANNDVRIEALQSHLVVERTGKKPSLIMRFAANIAKLWSFPLGKNYKLKQLLAAHNLKSQQMEETRSKIQLDLEDVANQIQRDVAIVASPDNKGPALVQFHSIMELGYFTFMKKLENVQFPPTIQSQVELVNNLFIFLDKLEKLQLAIREQRTVASVDFTDLDIEKSKQAIQHEEAREIFNQLLELCKNPTENSVSIEELKKQLVKFEVQALVPKPVPVESEATVAAEPVINVWRTDSLDIQYQIYCFLRNSKQAFVINPLRAAENAYLKQSNETISRDQLANELCLETQRYIRHQMDNNPLLKDTVQTIDITALEDLSQLINLNQVEIGKRWVLFIKHNQEKGVGGNSKLQLLAMSYDGSTLAKKDLLNVLTLQVKFLNSFLQNFKQAYQEYAKIDQSVANEGQSSALKIDFERLVDKLEPGNKSIEERYQRVCTKMSTMLSQMQDLTENTKGIARAIKFFTGQASYKLKPNARKEVVERLENEAQASYCQGPRP